MNTQGTSGGSVTEALPARYELIDKYGRVVGRHGRTFKTAIHAAEYAKFIFPEQEQDENREGRGWDVQIAVRP